MQKVLVLLAAIVIALSGCVSTRTSQRVVTVTKPDLSMSQEEQWSLMVGKWYGEQPTQDGGTRKWIVERFNQGSYRVDFQTVKIDGTIEASSEVGQWGVSGGVYFSSFRGWVTGMGIKPADPTDPYNYDAYRIIQLNSKIFEYEHYSTGNRFTVKRVASDFQFE